MATRTRKSTRMSTAASDSLAEVANEFKATTRGDSKKTTSSRSSPKAAEMKRLRFVASCAFLASTALEGGLLYLAYNDKLKLYPSSLKPESLKGFTSKAEYALRYQVLLFAWLFFNMISVIFVRFKYQALNPLESSEKYVQGTKNILTNSFEQIFLSVFLQLAFVSFADASLTLKLIPLINICQFYGRITFMLGYPMYRTFGFMSTLLPNILLLGFNLYRFGQYLQFF